MSEKIICVVETKRVKKGDNEWIELIDIEGKTHRIFGSIQAQDGTWKHFEDKFDALEKSEGTFIKLIKEKKGSFWNVIDVELDVKEQVDKLPPGQTDTSAMEKSAKEGEPYERRIDPQERGMFWKELGNRIGDGSIDRDFPKSAVKIKTQYYHEMAAVTKVKFKD